MGPNLESEFASMMAKSFGGHWMSDLPSRQISGMREAFFGGAVSVLHYIPISVSEAQPLRQQCREYLDNYKQAHGLN